MKAPRQFFTPLAIGAPAPLRELPVRLERMVHFVPPHLDKLRAKVPDRSAALSRIIAPTRTYSPSTSAEDNPSSRLRSMSTDG